MKKYVLLALAGAATLPLARAQVALPTLPNGQVRELKRFNAIRVGNGIALTIVPGHTQHVEVSASTPGFREHLLTTVREGELQLAYDDAQDREDRKLQRTPHELRVVVTADFITHLMASSGATVQAQGNFAAPDCVLDINSGAKLTASGLAPQVLVVRQSSGSTATLSGEVARLDIRVAGGSTLDAQHLQSRRGQVEASAGSAVRVAGSEDLLVEASGKSEVRYYGSPTLTQQVSSDSKLKNDR